MKLHFHRPFFSVPLIGAFSALASVLPAQTAAPAPAPATTAGPVTVMDKFVTSDVPVEDQVLPTVRPIGSVMGDDRSIIDTPRSVSSVNKAWMDDRQVTNAMDFGQFSPGVYSAAQYGVPGIPQIRGDFGEIYVNGQDTKYSRNTILPSFNGVESMDIVKGPGSADYGPQGQGPGGYVNFVTKKPFFDGPHTSVTATFGSWNSGSTNWQPAVQIDYGTPVSPQLAYRISYLDREGSAFYQDSKNRTHDLFAALTYRPSSKFTLDWYAQFYANSFNQMLGVNRVTQDYIWNQTYIAGPVQAANLFGGSSTASPIFLLLDTTKAYRTKVYPDQVVINPGDYAKTNRFQTQLTATAYLSREARLVNLTYFEDRTAKTLELAGYAAFVPTDYRIDNRTEYHRDFSLFGQPSKIITGVDVRYDRLVSYEDFSIEPFAIFDVTQPASTYIVPVYPTLGTVGGYRIPGEPAGYSANTYAAAGTQTSKSLDAAFFYQQDVPLTKNLSAVLGARLDRISATAANPALVGAAYGALYNASATVTDPSYFASLVYKPTEKSSLYFTFDRADAVSGSANFGGVDASAGHAGLVNSLGTISKLYEAGYKTSLLNNKAYASLAVFQQTRIRPATNGPSQLIRTNGLEGEAVYQPMKGLTVNANATFQDATAYAAGFYQQTGNYLDFYPAGYIVDGQSGTGKGSPNFTTYRSPTGKMRATGVPQFMANFFVQYELPSGLGVGLGPQIDGRQYANRQGTLHIPTQYELDGFVYYRTKSWDVRINIKNITNQNLYDTIDVTFAGNDVVEPRPPLSASITFRYRL